MGRRITSFIAIMVFIANGCYYDVEEELYPTTECSTLNMSYEMDILPILQKDCYSCHSAATNFGNITLEGYNKLIPYVNSGALLGVIQHELGFSFMPKGGAQLLDCEIAKIESWIKDGSLDN